MKEEKKLYSTNRQREIIGISIILISILLAMSLASYSTRDELILTHYTLIDNVMGFAGVLFSSLLIKWGIGYIAWGFIPLMMVWGVFILFNLNTKLLKRSTFFYSVILLLMSVLFSVDIYGNGVGQFPLLSGMLAYSLSDWIGVPPTIIILISLILMMVSGYFRFSITAPIQSLKQGKRIEKERPSIDPDDDRRMRVKQKNKKPEKVRKIEKEDHGPNEIDDILDRLRQPAPIVTKKVNDPDETVADTPQSPTISARVERKRVAPQDRQEEKTLEDNRP